MQAARRSSRGLALRWADLRMSVLPETGTAFRMGKCENHNFLSLIPKSEGLAVFPDQIP